MDQWGNYLSRPEKFEAPVLAMGDTKKRPADSYYRSSTDSATGDIKYI